MTVRTFAAVHHRGDDGEVVEKTVEPVPYDEAQALQVVGRHESDAMDLDTATDGSRLTPAVGTGPEIRSPVPTL
ncbi:hypothetical protein Kpho02_50480 [Kitasatospora phosalacinea]|uniref:Uncharacterized protein n=1 Tax=Kitasatospora phosalacinea TaxID=2065 RepID=A0A9W6QAM8_9ACTN|nr:hypothetical protein [Kitasatospora phosalacinea]GLW72749.1 hypothetical protein Kpho02_50480 [Kitasatospora phosalacinea]